MRRAAWAAALLLVLGAADVQADKGKDKDRIRSQQEELERIRKDVERSEKKLDSLRSAELQTTEQISRYDQKITANKKVIGRLTRQLADVHEQMQATEDRLGQSRDRLERARRKYLGDIRQFYAKATGRTARPLWSGPAKGLEENRQIVYLAALAQFESDNVADAGAYLSETLAMLDTLASQRTKVQSLKKDKETATALDLSQREKREKALEKIRRTKLAEGDKMLTLQQAADEIERVIALLEEQRERRESRPSEPAPPSAFATLKGQLPPPAPGKVTVPFGPAQDPVTKLKSYSPGITIAAALGAAVRAVAAGSVAYVGTLRGYGRFVIISHDSDYYTTYAGLGEPQVRTGDAVTGTTVLGRVGPEGQVKFELRQGREPLDPVLWIRLDAF
ncbi:MAG TPA: peptidoglycan DD-metalloendopeptidase family protein [candidate division Zixibacteria bacterium]|nr:peptidoglycan DD-metalloendopeptidase family protein [candidate division Zixibacteria bacterium]